MESTNKGKITNAALIVMSSIVLSRLTGFVREILVPYVLGVTLESDAYNAAFRITGLMYDLLVGGAIAAAIIPVLAGYIVKDKEEEGWKAIGTFINIVIVAMVIVCFLGMFFAPFIVRNTMGFRDLEQIKLTVDLTRILFPSVAFLMLAGLINGILNSYHRFAAAAFGPVLYNVGCALSIGLLGRTAFGIKAIAYGVMASSFLYFVFQLSFALKNLKFYRVKFHIRHSGFIKVLKLAIPSLLASATVQIKIIITVSFASLFEAGSVTAYNIADRTWQMPYGIFAQGMGVAILPTLAAKLANNEVLDFKRILSKGINMVLLVTIPSCVGFIVLREPIIRTLFQFNDKFSEEAIILTGNILMFFALALITQSIITILNRAFYAANDTITPLWVGIVTILVVIGTSFIFYKYTNLQAAGMALSYSIASALNVILLLYFLNLKVKGIYIKELIVFSAKVSIAAIFMGILIYYTRGLFPQLLNSKLGQLTYLSLNVFLGAVLYGAMVLMMRINEGIYLKNMCIDKTKKLASRLF